MSDHTRALFAEENTSMAISGATGIVGLVGYPARYSLSPAIHNAAYAAMQLDLRYVVFPVQPDALKAAVQGAHALNIVGLSVTVPHKEAVLPFLSSVTPAAKMLRSVNCVYREMHRQNDAGVAGARGDSDWCGDSTDGEGLVRALEDEFGTSCANARVVVLGAGGAARAAIAAIAGQHAREVIVVNRTAATAQYAASLAGAFGRVGTLDDIPDADIVVHATSVGMEGAHTSRDEVAGDAEDATGVTSAAATAITTTSLVPPSLWRAHHKVMDLIYAPRETQLLHDAKAAGAQTCNGIPMLVHQAARQIELWTGKTPPIDVMKAAVVGA